MSLETSDHPTTALSWAWLKSISRELFILDETPLLGNLPPFPWEKLSYEFAKCFSLENCTISPQELNWKEKNTILDGLIDPLNCVQLAATGIDGSLSLWISKADILLLMAKILQLPAPTLLKEQPEMVEAFHHFLSLQALQLINQLEFDKRISFKILSHDEAVPLKALCQDIMIAVGSDKILARVVISNEFRKSLSALFAKSEPRSGSTQNRLEQIQVPLHVEAGRVNLTMQELFTISSGDFVALDQIFFSPDDEKSRLLLTLEGKPLFHARLKQGSLKILEIPLHYEVYDSMVDKIRPVSPLDSPGGNLPPINNEATNEEDPFGDEEEDLELVEEEKETAPEPVKAAQKPPSPIPTAHPLSQLTANDIPVTVVVELAQITLSAQKILELQPGNLIDLNITPESGVNLVISGRIIGKGEILKIGDQIGVRVLEIGL